MTLQLFDFPKLFTVRYYEKLINIQTPISHINGLRKVGL